MLITWCSWNNLKKIKSFTKVYQIQGKEEECCCYQFCFTKSLCLKSMIGFFLKKKATNPPYAAGKENVLLQILEMNMNMPIKWLLLVFCPSAAYCVLLLVARWCLAWGLCSRNKTAAGISQHLQKNLKLLMSSPLAAAWPYRWWDHLLPCQELKWNNRRNGTLKERKVRSNADMTREIRIAKMGKSTQGEMPWTKARQDQAWTWPGWVVQAQQVQHKLEGEEVRLHGHFRSLLTRTRPCILHLLQQLSPQTNSITKSIFSSKS